MKRQSERRRASSHERRDQTREALLLQGVRDGSLTMAQAAGLDAADLEALADHAETCRRLGQLERASQTYRLLAAFDPYRPRWWRALGGLEQRSGQLLGSVSACLMLELLGAADAESVARREACLAELAALNPGTR